MIAGLICEVSKVVRLMRDTFHEDMTILVGQYGCLRQFFSIACKIWGFACRFIFIDM